MSDRPESLITTLLTGGILLGKICQALVPSSAAKTYVDPQSGVTVLGDMECCGVRFSRSDAEGDFKVWASNPSTDLTMEVLVPDEPDKGAVIYFIPPDGKVLFEEADNPLVSPLINVLVGPVGDQE